MSVIETILIKDDDQIKAALDAMSGSELRALLAIGYESEKQLNEWKRIAAWMAECHAANAEHVIGTKSASKSQKDRLVSISKRSAEQMTYGRLDSVNHRIGSTPQKDVQNAVDRCLGVEKYRV